MKAVLPDVILAVRLLGIMAAFWVYSGIFWNYM